MSDVKIGRVIDVAAGLRVVGSRLQKKKGKLARMTRRRGGMGLHAAFSTNLVICSLQMSIILNYVSR
jgi:hypothetical protein